MQATHCKLVEQEIASINKNQTDKEILAEAGLILGSFAVKSNAGNNLGANLTFSEQKINEKQLESQQIGT